MADPLSIASGIAGLVALVDVVFTKTYHYVREVKSADKTVKELVNLLEAMFGTLSVLKVRLKVLDIDQVQQSALYASPRIIEDCWELLEEIDSKLGSYRDTHSSTSSHMKATIRKLRWPFEVSHTRALVEQLSKFNQVLNTAINVDTLAAVHEIFNATSQLQDGIKQLERTFSSKFDRLLSVELSKEQHEAVAFFNICDPSEQHKIAKKIFKKGTGKWFTESEDFLCWLDGRLPELWLSGIPGAGKTILASTIIEKARIEASRSVDNTILAYFYCDYKDSKTQDLNNILSSLIAQVARQNNDTLDLLLQCYNKFYKPGRPMIAEEPPEMIELFHSLAESFDRVLLIVDGLDECGQNMSTVAKELGGITKELTGNISCIVLSRDEHEIKQALLPQQYKQVSIAAQSLDLKLFVHSQLDRLAVDDLKLKEKIVDTLVNKAEGMFRWVACQIDYLSQLVTDEAYETALADLPPDLNATYDRILQRVNQKPESTQKLVQLTMIWIIQPQKKLTIPELREALSIRHGQTKFAKNQMPNEQAILRHCSSLIRKSADGTSFELAHFTVEEYLRQISPNRSDLYKYRLNEEGSLHLAVSCLTYLNFEDFSDSKNLDMKTAKQRMEDYAFRQHAVQNWATYARFHMNDKICLDQAKSLFHPTRNTKFISWLIDTLWIGIDENYPAEFQINKALRGVNALHCAASLRLPTLVEWLIQEGLDVNAQSSVGTPLHCAIRGSDSFRRLHQYYDSYGYIDTSSAEVIEILVANDADANIPYRQSYKGGDITSMHLLLLCDYDKEQMRRCLNYLHQAGAEVDKRAASEAFADFSAIELIRLEQVQVSYQAEFLDQVTKPKLIGPELPRAQTNVAAIGSNDSQRQLLHAQFRFAAKFEQMQVLEEWIGYGDIDVNDTDADGNTALCIAAFSGSSTAVEYLLKHGADIHAKNNVEYTALHFAAEFGHTQIFNMLLERGADPEAKDAEGHNVWYCAGIGGNIEILEQFQAYSKNKDEKYEAILSGENSPLWAAAEYNQDAAILFLSSESHLVNLVDKDQRSLADHCGNFEPETLLELIRRGLDCTRIRKDNSTALHVLCKETSLRHEFLTFARILVKHGCSPEIVDSEGMTALHYFVLNVDNVNDKAHDSRLAALKLLRPKDHLALRSGTGPSILDSFFAESWFREGFPEVFGFLVGSGAVFECEKIYEPVFSKILSNIPWEDSEVESFLKMTMQSMDQMNVSLRSEVRLKIALWAADRDVKAVLKAVLTKDLNLLAVDTEISDYCILESVLSRGALSAEADTILQWFSNEELRDIQFRNGCGPLHAVCYRDSNASAQLISILCQRGLTLDCRTQPEHGTPLMLAAKNGHLNYLQQLTDEGANIRLTDSLGWNALHHAVDQNRIDVVRYFAEHFEDSSLWLSRITLHLSHNSMELGCNILHLAACTPQADMVTAVLDLMPEPDLEVNSQRHMKPLHCAAAWDSHAAIEYLIEKGACIDARDQDQRTPLHCAVSYSKSVAVEMLCKHGANLDATDVRGFTPLHFAAWEGNHAIASYLLQNDPQILADRTGISPDLTALARNHTIVAEMIRSYTAKRSNKLSYPTGHNNSAKAMSGLKLKEDQGATDGKDFRVQSALIKAIKIRNLELARQLMLVDTRKTDLVCPGCSPISIALDCGHTEFAKTLIKQGYSIRSVACDEHDFSGMDLLSIATETRTLTTILPLLSTMIKPWKSAYLHSYDGFHPLMAAASTDDANGLEELLRLISDEWRPFENNHESFRVARESASYALGTPVELVDAIYLRGATALHIAARYNLPKNVRTLLKYHAEPDCLSDDFATPLHIAAAHGCLEVIDILLDRGADIEARSGWGSTPVFMAAGYNKEKAVEKLLARGASLRISNVQCPCYVAFLESPTCLASALPQDQIAVSLPPNLSRLPPRSDIWRHKVLSLWLSSAAICSWFSEQGPGLCHYLFYRRAHGLKHVLRWLRQHEMLMTQLDATQPSPLCIATQMGDPDIVRTLLDAGANIDAVGCDQGTALALACDINRFEMVKFLVRNGAALHYIDPNGQRVSCFQAASKHRRILEWLLVGRWTEQRKLYHSEVQGSSNDPSRLHTSRFRPWSGVRRVEAPLGLEYKQVRGETLLAWHIRKRKLLKRFEGRVLYYGPNIEYPYVMMGDGYSPVS